jgi:hypothetical protein
MMEVVKKSLKLCSMTHDLGSSEQQGKQMSTLHSRSVRLADDLEAINDYFHQHAWTDGLPIIPPTQERVAAMMSKTARDRSEVVGRIPVRFAEATIEAIAINAVMAGCLPGYLPLIIAAIDALCDPALNACGIQATTSSAAVGLIINGPIINDLRINSSYNALGCGHRSNATIGRAAGKHTFCFAENEVGNPWEPFHVSRGFSASDSVVTLFAFSGTTEVVDAISTSAEGILTTIATSMVCGGSYGSGDILGGGEPLVVLCPEHARCGFGRGDVQRFLFERARLPLRALSPAVAQVIRDYRRQTASPAIEDDLRVCAKPDSILIVVAGGHGAKSTVIPSWAGGTHAISRKVFGQDGTSP